MARPRDPDVIAERELVCESDLRKKLLIKITRPKPGSAAVDFECAYQIVGPGVDINRYAVGADELQSLQLACVAIGAHLAMVEKQWCDLLTWRGGDCGFSKG